MPALSTSALAALIAETVFSYVLTAGLEDSGFDDALREKIRQRLGKKSPEQLAFGLALERALRRLDAAMPGWTQSLFDEHLLRTNDVAVELARLLQRQGQPDAGVLAEAWARGAATPRADLQAEARRAAQVFLRLLDEELDAPDVRPALAALRTSRDLASLRDQGAVLQELLDQVLQRLDASQELLAFQAQILARGKQRGLLRVEGNTIVYGNVYQVVFQTRDGHEMTARMSSPLLQQLMAETVPASQPARHDDCEALKEIMAMARRALAHLERQKAAFGLHTPPHILIDIEEKEKEIAKLQRRAAALECET